MPAGSSDKTTRLQRLHLIAITDPERFGWPATERAAAAALAGGLPALMLRERQMSDEELHPTALRLRELTRAAGSLLIINRRLDPARAVGADGVHLGKSGPTLAEARRRLGPDVLLGYSAHAHDEALAAFESGADYVFFSQIFDTPSKQGLVKPLGLEALARLASAAPGPVIALGGIDETNAASTLAAGAAGLAMIRTIFAAKNLQQTTRRLIEMIKENDRKKF